MPSLYDFNKFQSYLFELESALCLVGLRDCRDLQDDSQLGASIYSLLRATSLFRATLSLLEAGYDVLSTCGRIAPQRMEHGQSAMSERSPYSHQLRSDQDPRRGGSKGQLKRLSPSSGSSRPFSRQGHGKKLSFLPSESIGSMRGARHGLEPLE
jgi:hypothetical protein